MILGDLQVVGNLYVRTFNPKARILLLQYIAQCFELCRASAVVDSFLDRHKR